MIGVLRSLVIAVPAAAMFSAGSAALLPHSPATASPCAAASWSHHAALVVEHADGATVRLCIGFDGDSISGADMMRASGVEFATDSYSSLGDAVCQIDHEPASYPASCWSSSSPYWAFFVARGSGSTWQPSPRGIDSETFADGDAAGFRYDSQSGALAPPGSPAGVCVFATAAAQAQPTAQPLPKTASQTQPATASAATPAPADSTHGTPGVAAVVQAPASAPAAAGISGGVLAAAVVGGALLGLLAAQVLVRRRRS